MLSDEAVRRLTDIKTTLGFKSYSETILFLINRVANTREELINMAFEEVQSVLAKYTSELELVELLRVVYLHLTAPEVRIFEENVQEALKRTKSVLLRLVQELVKVRRQSASRK
jgi:predicted CopG family antitoxin